MRFQRIAITLALAVVLTTSGCFCGSRVPSTKDMVRYLNNKYDDHFAFYCSDGVESDGSGRQIYCTSEKYSQKTGSLVWVKYSSEDDRWTDTYLCVKFNDQAQALLRQILAEALPEGSYAYLPDTMCDGVSPPDASDEMTFEEYIASREPALSMIVIIDTQKCKMEKDDVLSKLESVSSRKGATFVSVDVFFAKEVPYHGPITSAQLSDFLRHEKLYERIRLHWNDK